MKDIKKILITGGAGYIGNELIKALPQSIEVVIVDNFYIDTPHKRSINKNLRKIRNLTLIESNVSDITKHKRFLKDIDVVIYMASLNSYKESNADPLLYLQENNINLRIFLNILEQCSPNIKKFILTSTRGIYGEGPYKCNTCKKRVSPSLSEKLQCPLCRSSDLSPQKIRETDTANPTSHYGITKKLQEDLLDIYCSEKKNIIRYFSNIQRLWRGPRKILLKHRNNPPGLRTNNNKKHNVSQWKREHNKRLCLYRGHSQYPQKLDTFYRQAKQHKRDIQPWIRSACESK